MPPPSEKVAPPYVPTLTQKLYAVRTRVIVSQAEAKPHKPEHIRYLTSLEAQGRLFASGPFPSNNEGPDLGLIILRAGSLEEAEGLMKTEPMTAMGLSIYDIHEWHLSIGHIPITLNVSSGSFTF